MDFFRIIQKESKDGTIELRPDWRVGRTRDLMTRSGSFYAVWDEEANQWSTDIYDVARLVDAALWEEKDKLVADTGRVYVVKTMASHSSKLWDDFSRYIRNSGDNSHALDETLTFADTVTTQKDYSSKRLPYSVTPGCHDSWVELIETLYSDQERAKIEWAIGAVLSGDSTTIQKFLVFYGPPGSGKSTILNIIEKMFNGYVSIFDARELAGSNNTFATAAFKANPLVAIQHDGDLSKIVDNTKLNSIVSHEIMMVNEKYKAAREARSKAFIFMGTNVPVKITDAKSGILRRLIDVVPTGNTIPHSAYFRVMNQIDFELGAIAAHCLETYTSMGPNFYSEYKPQQMMKQTDVFYNFVEDHLDVWKEEDGVTLKRAYALYKAYCEETGIERPIPRYKLQAELAEYFEEFRDRALVDGVSSRSVYIGFKTLNQKMPAAEIPLKVDNTYSIGLEEHGQSILDEVYASMPAQYTKGDGTPKMRWDDVTTTLSDLDTTELHYVQIPDTHIVVDFDLTDETGDKNLELNLAEASKWPPTYAEVSRSGQGLHLHYIYAGDVTELDPNYSDEIEVKTLLGKSSLRRQFIASNNVTLSTISSGLPKKAKGMISNQGVKSERALRALIERNLRKEVHPGTKPSIDFIHHILEDAFDKGMAYDVTDMRSTILTFAAMSSNQAQTCIKLVQSMKFAGAEEMAVAEVSEEEPIVFIDVEVFPNLLVVCWKAKGSQDTASMINPTPEEVEELMGKRLVGFNNRRYDNHILYARFLGYTNEQIYNLSKAIITGGNQRGVLFGPAYNLSYADVYDFSSKKQGLKAFELELGIHHSELNHSWDDDLDKKYWDEVVEYCINDVVATEAVFNARAEDFNARLILASLSGLTPNHSTAAHTSKIIFGGVRDPQRNFVYTDLSTMFEGYKYDFGESTFMGEVTGEGGYVYAEPGYYENVTVLDIASMHPASIVALDAFGPYTPKFQELMDARLAIKRGDYELARSYLDGKLTPFLKEEDFNAEELSYALKIIINTVYGLTSAKFENTFKDKRNKDNIVAKRGALFMVKLKHEVQEKGFTVAHIKTDSIKIPNATQEIIDFVVEFGKKYDYDFEVEDTYERFCLVNDAVYVARQDGVWTTVGAQFLHPYVHKTCFSKEEVDFEDLIETKNVKQGVIYMADVDEEDIKNMAHIGRTGSFVCVQEGKVLWRVKEDKKYAVTGTKGFLWISRDLAKTRASEKSLDVDYSYYEGLVEKAIATINKFTDFEQLTAKDS